MKAINRMINVCICMYICTSRIQIESAVHLPTASVRSLLMTKRAKNRCRSMLEKERRKDKDRKDMLK